MKKKCPNCKEKTLEIEFYDCPMCGGCQVYECSECGAMFEIKGKKSVGDEL